MKFRQPALQLSDPVMPIPASRGFTLIELLVSLAIGALVLFGLQRTLTQGIAVAAEVEQGVALDGAARFALDRMVLGVRHSNRLILPGFDDPATDWREDLRVEFVPAIPPTASNTLDTAILAVALPAHIDINGDGFADADNDRDGRVDEDWPADVTADGAPGLIGLDDDGDGQSDEEFQLTSDDETATADDDPLNRNDDNSNGLMDEDPGADRNGDGQPGIAGVDDDADGQIDEGDAADDDEDGLVDEDWLDPLAFYLVGDALMERRAVPWDANNDGFINGADFVESVIADGVQGLSVERLPQRLGGVPGVQLTLALGDESGRTVELQAIVRLAGGGQGVLQ